MSIILTDSEIRVLGSLVEKETTTPEYYPLSLNSLTAACNQKSNREPVVSYDESTVAEACDSLREKDLVILIKDTRALKYDNYFADKLGLSPAETAVMGVLMLRGPQTVGELRTRTERLHSFADLTEVESVLESLAGREDPLAVRLQREVGRKEPRWAHLLAGEPAQVSESPGALGDPGDPGRIDHLEEEIAALRRDLDELREQFAGFRRQFE